MYIIKKCRKGHQIHIHDSGKVKGVKCPYCMIEVMRYYAKHKKFKVRFNVRRLQEEIK